MRIDPDGIQSDDSARLLQQKMTLVLAEALDDGVVRKLVEEASYHENEE